MVQVPCHPTKCRGTFTGGEGKGLSTSHQVFPRVNDEVPLAWLGSLSATDDSLLCKSRQAHCSPQSFWDLSFLVT